jgi:uncharacterized protein YtpQ (UPF0354 family)
MDKGEASSTLLQMLKEGLNEMEWEISFDEEHVRIQNLDKVDIGLQVSVSSVLARLEKGKEQIQIQETARKAIEILKANLMTKTLKGNEQQIFPVLRSRSHPQQTREGKLLYTKAHTAESQIFYAFDLGDTYVLIDEQMASDSGYGPQDIDQFAIANVKRLDTSCKQDEVAGSFFYLFGQPDGYAASRVLNDELLSFMRRKIEGQMGVAIPHQDVLIVADIRNEIGYKVLAKLNMDFCVKGDIPISPLPFIYTDENILEPIMIMANPGGTPNVIHKNASGLKDERD